MEELLSPLVPDPVPKFTFCCHPRDGFPAPVFQGGMARPAQIEGIQGLSQAREDVPSSMFCFFVACEAPSLLKFREGKVSSFECAMSGPNGGEHVGCERVTVVGSCIRQGGSLCIEKGSGSAIGR